MRARVVVLCALFGAACSLGRLSGFSGGEEEAPAPAPDSGGTETTDSDASFDATAPYVEAGLEDVDAASRPQLYRDAVMANTPLAYYRFEETTATSSAKDETGTRDATWEGAPQFGADGVFPGTHAASFPKGADARLRIPGSDLRFSGNVPYAFEAWLHPAKFFDYEWIASTEAPRQGWSVLTDVEGRLHYEVWDIVDGGKASVRFLAPTARKLLLNVYQHAVIAYDGTKATVWIDGVRLPDGNWPKPAPDVGTLVVGCRDDGDGTYSNCLEDWLIDELAIYGHVLTDQDVALHYAIVRQGL